MKSMKALPASRRVPTSHKLAIFTLLVGAGTSAQACDIWRDGHLNLWSGKCNLSVDYRDRFRGEDFFVVEVNRPWRLKVPDLRIRKFKYFISGSQVTISADIVNDGMVNAPAADLAVTVDIGNPLTGMQARATTPFAVRVPATTAGATQRVTVGVISIPTNQQDWDLVLLGIVDPPTPASQVHGAIFESSESNNNLTHACRYYGPNPDLTLEPCN
jgi:hypothetical protein